MGLFSGMEKYGLGEFENTEIIEKPAPKSASKSSGAEKPANQAEEVKPKEEDYLFDKRWTCPICDKVFVAKSVRASKAKLVGKDTDLRPIYEGIDPQKYDVITCDKCGYSSVTRYFGKFTTKQGRAIRDAIGNHFMGIATESTIYNYDDAILRYKLALICSIVKNAKNSERAYTSLKLAWVIRAKRNELDEKKEKEEFAKLQEDEMECLKNAYEGFEMAMSREPFPIAGIDEISLKYILADIARKLKKYDVAMRFVADILTSRTASQRIKDEALKQKELIRGEMKSQGEKAGA